METLEVAHGFDVHEYRHGLKLLRQDRKTTALRNRGGFGCPACGERFEKLLVTTRRENSLGRPDAPICVVRTDDEVLVLSHPNE